MSSPQRSIAGCPVSDVSNDNDDIGIGCILDDDISSIVDHVLPSSRSIPTTDFGDIEQHLDQIAQSLINENICDESTDSTRTYNEDELHTFSMNMCNYYDLLMFYWYYVFGQRWIRGLMMSDCHYTMTHLNEAITIRESLNDDDLGTSDLYDKYCGRLESENDVKFVFGEVNHLIDSDRFFSFQTFAARIMFALCKFDLYPFYNGQPLPRDFQDWRSVVICKMQNYMLNVLRLESTQCRSITIEVLCPEQRPVPYILESPRRYAWNLMHDHTAYPKVLPIAMDLNSFRLQCPVIQIDMNHHRAVQTLNVFRVQWTTSLYFKGRADLEWLAQLRWPRFDHRSSPVPCINSSGARGEHCYDVHQTITAYLDHDGASIMVHRAASSYSEQEGIDRMRSPSPSPSCTFSPSPCSPAESTLNLSISFPIDSLGKEQAFRSKRE